MPYPYKQSPSSVDPTTDISVKSTLPHHAYCQCFGSPSHHWSFELTGLTALVSSIHFAYTWKASGQIQIQFCYSFYFENRRSKNKSQSNDVVNRKQAHLITWYNTKSMCHQVYLLWVHSYSTPYFRTKLNKLICVSIERGYREARKIQLPS